MHARSAMCLRAESNTCVALTSRDSTAPEAASKGLHIGGKQGAHGPRHTVRQPEGRIPYPRRRLSDVHPGRSACRSVLCNVMSGEDSEGGGMRAGSVTASHTVRCAP